ncbi:MAG: LLM class flavin-dependent oxidoreductase [Porticoccaceae bacterium]|nr:MAG: LLM class flavin-dependent oxidoreductase [Porticoccaceae bacterium]
MKVGQLMLFQNHPNLPQSDYEMYQNELDIALMAEPLGLDSVWAVEHHFTDYTLCPNIPEFLAFVAGQTKTIKLGTAAIILPWHKDPIRVATDIAMLDNMSKGRVLLGMGRGLAKIEYDGFGIDMAESRDRMNEMAAMVLEALETGFMEGNGKYFRQERREIRPRPFKSFRDRTFIVSMSPDTAPHAARLGGSIMTFAIGPWEKRAQEIERWREFYRKEQGGKTPPPTSANLFVICDKDPKKAADMAYHYMSDYWISAMVHYEMKGEHFGDRGKGAYDFYHEAAKAMRSAGDAAMGRGFADLQIWGTPAQCLEKIERIQNIIGPMDINCSFSFAGMPYEYARKSMKLFAEQVVPVVRDWEAPGYQAA